MDPRGSWLRRSGLEPVGRLAAWAAVAAWFGFWGALAGIPAGVFLAVYADRAGRGRKKRPLLLCCATTFAGGALFAVACAGNVFPSRARLGVLYLGAVAASPP